MIKVAEVPLSLDLSTFAEFLWRHEIPHRILEKDGVQQLWVGPGVDPGSVRSVFDHWRDGGDLNDIQVSKPDEQYQGEGLNWKKIWLCVTLMVTSLAVAFLTALGDNFEYFRWFTITDLVMRDGQVYSTDLSDILASGQIWRLASPIFLHFSILHILFNLLWVWIVGTRIEVIQGRWALGGLVLFSGIASNIAQFYISGPLFGGMSGVVFALIGYAWFWDRRNPARRLGLPPALMGFMLVWLALGYSGLLESAGLGAIANTAHLAGMIAGLAFVPIGEKLARKQTAV